MKIDQLHKSGFSLILLKPKRKQPLENDWASKPKSKLSDIMDGYIEGCNIGFRPGVTSKTEDGMFIHGIDLDIRIAEDRDEAVAKLEELFGRKFLMNCPRVKSGSGGDSRHFYFKLPRPTRAKTVAHSKDKFFDEVKQNWRWRWEIEVFGEGKQMVLPPSIHPDTGREYEWVREPKTIPTMEDGRLEDILDEITRPISEFDDEDIAPLGLSYDEAERIVERLDFERWFVERDGWRNVGMALHHEFNASKEAFKIWTRLSKQAKNFDPDEQRYQWSTFGRNQRVRPFRMASLMKEAQLEDVREMLQSDSESDAEAIAEIREINRKKKEEAKQRRKNGAVIKTSGVTYRIDQPARLMTVPGMLGEVVSAYNDSAARPQPQFAVHTALALGSTILGRNWRTDMNNYSSLYFLLLGRTASGKEHGLKVVSAVLDQCELDLAGPSRYTSDAGVMSALEIRPKHISLADEFSRYLKSSRTSGDANMANAQSSLMEVWGRLDGIHRNKGYSARGMTKQQMEDMARSHVKRPAISMLGVAVPDDFYSAISDEDVASGFLNRFLICETEIPRLPMADKIRPVEVSSEFRKWAREHAFPLGEDDEDIIDAINRNSPTDPGEPIEVPFSDAAKKLLRKMDIEYLAIMDGLDAQGLDGLYGRAREIVMRLSLVVAKSCMSDVIDLDHVEWCREYVEYHLGKLEGKTREDMGASDSQKLVSKVFELIDQASRDDDRLGLTMRELVQVSKAFRNLDTRQREEIFKILASDHGVVFRHVQRTKSKRSVKVATTNFDI